MKRKWFSVFLYNVCKFLESTVGVNVQNYVETREFFLNYY